MVNDTNNIQDVRMWLTTINISAAAKFLVTAELKYMGTAVPPHKKVTYKFPVISTILECMKSR